MTTTRVNSASRGEVDAPDMAQRMVMYAWSGLHAAVFLVSVSVAASMSGRGPGERVGTGVTLFAIFLASSLAGSCVGFLFGLPRSRFADQVRTDDEAKDEQQPLPAGSRYVANSNLVKVSDWLTTIVIGLGLVNLGNVVPAAREFASAIREPLGGAPYAGALGASILVTGLISGFLLAYLWISIKGRALLEESELRFERVPDLVGMTLGEARKAISATTLKLVTAKAASDESKITEQDCVAGMTVREGQPIRVAVEPPPPSGDKRGDSGSLEITMFVDE